MTLNARNAFITKFIPEEFTALFIDADQTPLVRLFFLIRRTVAVNANFQIGFAARFDGSDDEYVILPDDWARMAEARNRLLPSNIFAVFKVPVGGSGLGGKAGAIRAAELGPVRGGGQGGDRQQKSRWKVKSRFHDSKVSRASSEGKAFCASHAHECTTFSWRESRNALKFRL